MLGKAQVRVNCRAGILDVQFACDMVNLTCGNQCPGEQVVISMKNLFFGVILTSVLMFAGGAFAQQPVWVQVAATRSLKEAQDHARTYASGLQNVNGFVMSSGWYAIALGPFAPSQANATLAQLRESGLIPRDSYIAFSNGYRRQFWPVGAATLTARPVEPAIQTTPGTSEIPTVLPLNAPDETLAEARRSERDLNREDRMLLQAAMKWEGQYTTAIDGAFGPGTRRAMASWQDANRFEATGVLTTKQRSKLVRGYQEMLASIGMQPLIENTAGIEIDLPMAMIEFDRYEPPFAHFKSRNDSGVKVLLISQSGDDISMRGLYDIMQTLEIVPLDGPREIGKRSFTLTGVNSNISTYSYAKVADGQLKGFLMTWPVGQDRRRDVVLDAMRASFRPFADAVLPEIFGDPNAAQAVDLLAGLAIRQPDMSRSGFYIDDAGSVLTTTEVVGRCERITLDDSYRAELVASDSASGLALLRPEQGLTPVSYARFLPGIARINSEVSVSGYSYGGILGAPTLTYGTLADLKGLAGETSVKRLALAPTQGDVGGPVFDASGSVMGMLLPVEQNGRRLPADVSFAADTVGIIEFLSANGIAASASDAGGTIAPEDLTIAAANMTVLVSCWN